MPQATFPQTGDTVRFSKVPAGSYCSVGEAYRVTRQGKTFHFQNVESGSGTSDQAWAVARSEWAAA